MKERLNSVLTYIKNNKKKSCIIAVVFLLITITVVVTILLLNIKGKGENASSGNITSKSESVESTAENRDGKSIDSDTTADNTTPLENGNLHTDEKQGTDKGIDEGTDENRNSAQTGSNATSGSYYGALKVSGNQLTDANGNPVQLKGISTHGIAWYPDYINNECFKELHESFGINVIRLAMYTAEYNGYCTGGDKSYLKGLVENGVQYATDNKMYAIIDWHILSDGNPNTYQEDSKAFFREMASKYAENDHVIYEICNEPNGGTTWSDIKSYATEVIDVIRQYDNDAIIIVGTPNWSQYVDQAAADPITGYDNIMYALHFYAATHKENLRNKVTTAIDAGLPIFVTEFGICDASGNGGIDESQSEQWIQLMNSRGVSYVMWNLSNKGETSAILNTSCARSNGFHEEDLSPAGKWFLKMMTGGLILSNNVGDQDGVSNQYSETNQDSGTNQESGTNQDNDKNSDIKSQQYANVGASAKMVNSWKAEGKTFYQFDITVTNNSGADCGSWGTDIHFNENIELSNSWNGIFSINGTTVHITSSDYNGALGNGVSTGNIGMIVSGSGNLGVK